MTAAEITERLASRGFDDESASALAEYANQLERWNRVHNLTGIRDREELVERHLVESLALAPYVSGPDAADIGSGAGLPGIPLAIRLPGIRFTLIESRRKRVSFLRQVVATLGLANVTVAQGRAESLTLEPFATVLARAVAPPAELLALAAPLTAPGGRLVLLTSRERGDEAVGLAHTLGFREVSPEREHKHEHEPEHDLKPDHDLKPEHKPALKSRIVVLERVLS